MNEERKVHPGRARYPQLSAECVRAASEIRLSPADWFPLAVAAAFTYLVATWRRGRRVLWDKLYDRQPALAAFIAELDPALIRVRGTAVYMTGNPDVVPTVLRHNIEHNQVLHRQVVLMTVRTQDIPYVAEARRVEVEALNAGFFRVVVGYGFMDQPDVRQALEFCQAHGLRVDPPRVSYFLGREMLIPTTSLSAVSACGTDRGYSGTEDFWIIVAIRSEDETETRAGKSAGRADRPGHPARDAPAFFG